MKKDLQQRNLLSKKVEEIIEVERAQKKKLNLSDIIAAVITKISGSMYYVILHVIWFGGWLVLNSNIFGLKPFDPFPFSLLTMIVSLEAIFLSSFVLISQNRQEELASKRSKIDLIVNMIAEQEATRIIEILEEIKKSLKIKMKPKYEDKVLVKRTDIELIGKVIDKAEKKAFGKKE